MGLFDQYFQDPVKAALDEQADAATKRGPLGQLAFEANVYGQRADQNFREAAGALFNVDTRTDPMKQRDAVADIKAKLTASRLEPGSAEYLALLAKLFQGHGMVEQAIAVAGQAEAMRAKQAEEQRKGAKTTADISAIVERNAIARARVGGDPRETEQLLSKLDTLSPGDPQRQFLINRLNALAKGSDVKFFDLGDRVQIIDAQTGAEIREEAKGAKPETLKEQTKREEGPGNLQSGYDQTRLKMQGIYDSILRLARHPGTQRLVGYFSGLAGESDSEKTGGASGYFSEAALASIGDDGRAALQLYKQIGGQAFLGALTDLKQESKAAGARGSGLGALSDAEGKRIVQAAAAIGLRQPVDAFYKSLAIYADQIAKSAALMDEHAARADVKVKPLVTAPITAPPARRVFGPRRTPAAAPAPGASGAWSIKKKE